MKFTKMQGLGNDYLYVYGDVPTNASELSIRLSERHFGAGSDGMIWITPSETADFGMRIFNADGSEAMMCGNGIRCVGKYVYDRGYTDKTHLIIETLSGLRTLDLTTQDGRVQSVTVDMGVVTCEDPQELTIGGGGSAIEPVTLTYTAANVGNPHAVFFVENAEDVPLSCWGPLVEPHPSFPGGVNAEFAHAIDATHLRMRVWERGSGITMACGTGTCATVAAAVQAGICPAGEPISVELDGGTLHVTITDTGVAYMRGPAEFVYDGEDLHD